MNSRFDQYINTYPRESLFLIVTSTYLLIHIPATILGTIIYLLFIKKYKVSVHLFIIISALIFLEFMYLNFAALSGLHLTHFIKDIFNCNWHLLNLLFNGQYQGGLSFLIEKLLTTTFYFPFFIASSFAAISLIKNPAHVAALNDLKNGVISGDKKEINDKKLQKALNKLPEDSKEGTVLGVSMYTGLPVIVPDKFINQIALVLGTTGSGKTVTLRRFYHHAIAQKFPLIIVDGKPEVENIHSLKALADKYDCKFYGFNCANYLNYDALANGGHTELKDKIVSLKDEWSSDYYKSIAEDYLQTTFEVLQKKGGALSLRHVVECLNYEDLYTLAKLTKNKKLKKRVINLGHYNREELTGLQAHLNILINSELGKYFELSPNRFSLNQIINEGSIAYFALPALRFPSFSKVLGKLVINDIKAVIDRLENKNQKVFTIFDEFSVFAGEQVLNLVNMGRGKGVHAVFGTQGLADLDKVDRTFKNQVLNCVNTIICHRLNDDESVETVASWTGTKDMFTVTGQLDLRESSAALGSVRVNKEFIIHPDEIKQDLQIGMAFYVTKVEGFRWDKIVIKSNDKMRELDIY